MAANEANTTTNTPSASKPTLEQTKPTSATAAHPKLFKMRLDLRSMRERIDQITKNAQQRNAPSVDAKAFVEAYDKRLSLDKRLNSLRAKRNEISKTMKQLMSPSANVVTDRQKTMHDLELEGRQIKEEIVLLEEEARRADSMVMSMATCIPNDTHPDTPIGPEINARLIKAVKQQEQRMNECKEAALFKGPWLDHVALGQRWDLFDFESAALVSGTSFYYLRKEAALLELALVQWAISRCVAHGFVPVMTPDVVRVAVANACGFQPRDDEASQSYGVSPMSGGDHTHQHDTLCLSGTAEIPLAGLFANKVVEEPQRVVAFGQCFRAEAGGRGRENRGLYRVHQFSKVEMFAVCQPEISDAILEEIRQIQEGLLNELGLDYR
jgi:seryl-tRNA synthetase